MTFLELMTDVVAYLKWDGAGIVTPDVTNSGFKTEINKLVSEFVTDTWCYYVTNKSAHLTASSDIATLGSKIFYPTRVIIHSKVIPLVGVNEKIESQITAPSDGEPSYYWILSGERIQFDKPVSTAVAAGTHRIDGFAGHHALSNDSDVVHVDERWRRALAFYCAFHIAAPIASDPITVGRLNSYIQEAERMMDKMRGVYRARYS